MARAAEARYLGPPEWAPTAVGIRRWTTVDDQIGSAVGAVHTGFGICELEPGGVLPGHVHSFEQSFFMLEGEAVLTTPDGSFVLGSDDYGLVPVGVPHAWRNDGDVTARWADMQAPQPRTHHHGDTIPVDLPGAPWPFGPISRIRGRGCSAISRRPGCPARRRTKSACAPRAWCTAGSR